MVRLAEGANKILDEKSLPVFLSMPLEDDKFACRLHRRLLLCDVTNLNIAVLSHQ